MMEVLIEKTIKGKLDKGILGRDTGYIKCNFDENLEKSIFIGCIFDNCVLDGNLKGSKFVDCYFNECSFTGDLEGANIIGSGVTKCRLSRNLTDLNFRKCFIEESHIEKIYHDIEGVIFFQHCILKDCVTEEQEQGKIMFDECSVNMALITDDFRNCGDKGDFFSSIKD